MGNRRVKLDIHLTSINRAAGQRLNQTMPICGGIRFGRTAALKPAAARLARLIYRQSGTVSHAEIGPVIDSPSMIVGNAAANFQQ